MCKNLAKWLPHRICTESAAITLSTTCDLDIECVCVRAIWSLDVRVATIVVRMMKRKRLRSGASGGRVPVQEMSIVA